MQSGENNKGPKSPDADLLKTMLTKPTDQNPQRLSDNNVQPVVSMSSSVNSPGAPPMGLRPVSSIKLEPGQRFAKQVRPHQMHPQMQHSQQIQQAAKNPMIALADMARSGIEGSNTGQLQNPMPQQMSPAQIMNARNLPRMSQNLTPQQQMMMIRFQQQQRNPQPQPGGSQQSGMPYPGSRHGGNRPRMPMVKQEPGTMQRVASPQNTRVASPQSTRVASPQNIRGGSPQTGYMQSRGPTPPDVRRTPSSHGSEGSHSPLENPNARPSMQVQVKKEGRPGACQGQPGMQGLTRQYTPGQGHHLSMPNPDSQVNKTMSMQGSFPGVPPQMINQNRHGNPPAQLPSGVRGQMDPGMMPKPGIRPPGMLGQMSGQAPPMLRGQTPAGRARPDHMGVISMRPGMPSVNPKSPSSAIPNSDSHSSFMQMLNDDDSDLFSLMSTQSQYSGVTGSFNQNPMYSQSSIRPEPDGDNMSFMQLLTDSATPPPDSSDPRQNVILDQQSFQGQIRVPMPTPPMSDPLSGSPHEYNVTQQNRSSMMPVSSSHSTTMSSDVSSLRMPYRSGAGNGGRPPPPYPGTYSQSSMNSQGMSYSPQFSQGYSTQQGMHASGHSQVDPRMSTGQYSQHRSMMPVQGVGPYPSQQGYPGHMGQHLRQPFMKDTPPDPWSPSTIPPNRDISVNPPQELRHSEYMEMDNMHEELVQPIVIAPIDDRIATKMDRGGAKQDMMSLQNMVNRLDTHNQSFIPPPNTNYPMPNLSTPPRHDPRWYQLLSTDSRSPEVQLVSAHGDFTRMSMGAPPPSQKGGLNAKSHKLLKSMKKLKIVLKKLDLKGRTTVRLGRKKSKHKEKERIRKHSKKEYRRKHWAHVDRSHVYERRKKKRESIAVSSESTLSEDSSEEERRRRRRRRHDDIRRKRKSLSSEDSYMSDSEYEERFPKSRKRRTRAKKPQYYLGSDDEFEYESSLTGLSTFIDTPIDITVSQKKWNKMKNKSDSDVEFDPDEFGSLEENSSDASSSESESSGSDTETDSDEEKREREPRMPKKKQTSLKTVQRFRSSSSDNAGNEALMFDSDDEEYTPIDLKKAKRPHSKSKSTKKKRRKLMSSSQEEETPKSQKKKGKKGTIKKKKAKHATSDADATESPSDTESSPVKPVKKKGRNAKKKPIVSDSEESPQKCSPPKKSPKQKAVSKGKAKPDIAKEKNVKRATRRTKLSKSSAEKDKTEKESISISRRTRSQIRKDSRLESEADTDKTLDAAPEVVSTSEEAFQKAPVQEPSKISDAQTEVSSTSENPVKQCSGFVSDIDGSPKEVSSTSESRKDTKEKGGPCLSQDNSNSSTGVGTTNEPSCSTKQKEKAGLSSPDTEAQNTSENEKPVSEEMCKEMTDKKDLPASGIEKCSEVSQQPDSKIEKAILSTSSETDEIVPKANSDIKEDKTFQPEASVSSEKDSNNTSAKSELIGGKKSSMKVLETAQTPLHAEDDTTQKTLADHSKPEKHVQSDADKEKDDCHQMDKVILTDIKCDKKYLKSEAAAQLQTQNLDKTDEETHHSDKDSREHQDDTQTYDDKISKLGDNSHSDESYPAIVKGCDNIMSGNLHEGSQIPPACNESVESEKTVALPENKPELSTENSEETAATVTDSKVTEESEKDKNSGATMVADHSKFLEQM